MDASCPPGTPVNDPRRGPTQRRAKSLSCSHRSYDSSEGSYESIRGLTTSYQAHNNISTITKLQKEHTIRRREHNRRAQRACRERRVQYTLDLEAKIEELSTIVQTLQDDNRALLRQVCDLRAQNIDLRTSLSSTEAWIGSVCRDSIQPLDNSSTDCLHIMNKKDLKPLHQPFSALWNLLSSYLGTECTSQELAAALEQLKAEVVLTTNNQPI